MGVFSASEDNRTNHLVAVSEKLASPIGFGHEIVLADFRAQADFFVLALVSVALVKPLFLLVFELAKVHHAANRRLLQWRHFDEIKALLTGLFQGFVTADDTQLGAVCGDDAYRGRADLFIDPLLLIDLTFSSWDRLGNGKVILIRIEVSSIDHAASESQARRAICSILQPLTVSRRFVVRFFCLANCTGLNFLLKLRNCSIEWYRS